MRTNLMMVAVGLTMLTSPALAEELSERSEDIQIDVAGAEQTSFSGECVVTTREGEEEKRLSLEGTVPQEHEVTGDSVNCAITQTSPEGDLQVQITKGRSVSRASAQGHESTVNVHLE